MHVVVLGANGYLGSNLVRLLQARVPVMAVSRIAQRTETTAPFGIWTTTLDALAERGPALVVNATGIADVSKCNREPMLSEHVNHTIARDIGKACFARGIPLVHISTDGLFGQGKAAGAPAYFRTSDATKPINAYARSKRAAEESLERLGWGSVWRLSFVGPDNGTGRGLVRFLAECALNVPHHVPGYVDSWFTPVHVRDVADAIVAETRAPSMEFSIRHVASYPAVTKFDYLQRVLDASNIAMTVAAVEAQSFAPEKPVDQTLACDAPVPMDAVVAASAADLRAMLAVPLP